MRRSDKIEVGVGVYSVVAAFIFLFIGVAHGLRAFYGWEVTVEGWSVPLWFSWLVALVGFLMSLTAIRRMR